MKTTILIATLTVCGGVLTHAQEERTITTKPVIIEPVKPKANEVITEKGRYSGILVHASKADDPIQLVNPAAPAEYGPGEQNVTRDPMNGKVDGLRLFSFSFKPREKRVPQVTVKPAAETAPVVKASETKAKTVKAAPKR